LVVVHPAEGLCDGDVLKEEEDDGDGQLGSNGGEQVSVQGPAAEGGGTDDDVEEITETGAQEAVELWVDTFGLLIPAAWSCLGAASAGDDEVGPDRSERVVRVLPRARARLDEGGVEERVLR
ncbi:unnamed protein product, partial [Tilletia controversa]